LKAFIVYCHPSDDSFTRVVKDKFVNAIADSGNTSVISDLYKMGFNTDMTEGEYLRKANYDLSKPIPDDINIEQAKINTCDALVFIYPVFWTEAPAKLVGWFDRVWTYGFAYGNKTMKNIPRSLILCVTGRPIDHLDKFGHVDSMKRTMLGDRLFDRVEQSSLVILDGMSRADRERRTQNWEKHLMTTYELGLNLFK